MPKLMQEAFEDMASSQGEWPQAIEKSPDGSYKFMRTHNDWEVWQAAWEASREALSQPDKSVPAPSPC